MCNDPFITLREAAKDLPKQPSPATFHRWTRKGSGGKVLQTWRIGGRIYTTREAFQDFITPGVPAEEPTEAPSPEMKAELAAAGIL